MLKRIVGAEGVAAGFAPDRHFTDHDGHAEEEDAEQVDDHKCAAAVHSGDVGELPDISETDRGTDGRHDESEVTAPSFSFFHFGTKLSLCYVLLLFNKK